MRTFFVPFWGTICNFFLIFLYFFGRRARGNTGKGSAIMYEMVPQIQKDCTITIINNDIVSSVGLGSPKSPGSTSTESYLCNFKDRQGVSASPQAHLHIVDNLDVICIIIWVLIMARKC